MEAQERNSLAPPTLTVRGVLARPGLSAHGYLGSIIAAMVGAGRSGAACRMFLFGLTVRAERDRRAFVWFFEVMMFFFSRCAALRAGVLILCAVTVLTAQTTPAPTPFASANEVWTALARLAPGQTLELTATLDRAAEWVTPALWYRGLTAAATTAQQDPAAALWHYEIAQQLARRLNQPRPLALTAYYLGGTYASLNQLVPALAAYRDSQRYFAAVGSIADQVYVVSDLGALQFISGDYPAARASAEQALSLAAQARANQSSAAALHPLTYGEAGAWFTLGVLAAREGRPAEADEHLRRAVTLYQELSAVNPYYRLFLADTYAAQGRLATDQGRYTSALDYLNQALSLAQAASPPERVAGILNSLGYLYLEQEDYPRATTYFNESLALYRTLNNRAEIARVQLNLAVIAQRQGDYATARDAFRQSGQEAAAAAQSDLVLAAGEGLGVVLTGLGQYEAARRVLQEHLTQARQAGNELRTAELLWRLAETHYAIGEDEQTITLAQAALAQAERLHLAKLSALAATTLGQAYFRRQAYRQAESVWLRAVQRWEELRGAVAGPPLARQLLWENKTTPYQALAVLCLRQNRPWAALQWLERAKGRVLWDILQEARAPSARLVAPTLAARAKPGHAAWPDFDPAKLRALWPASEGTTAYLNYLVTPEATFLFVLTRPRASGPPTLHVLTLSLTGAELTAQVHQFHNLMAQRYPALATSARALDEALLQPARPYLKGVTTLGLVPDGALWDLPFQALVSPAQHYLLEDYALFYAPSLSVLAQLNQQPTRVGGSKTLLALGNPRATQPAEGTPVAVLRAEVPGPLPEAEAEVQAVGQLYGSERSRILVQSQATEAAFRQWAPTARVLHLATHGVVQRRTPLASYLLLAGAPTATGADGWLEAREILGLELQAELAVLSACETGRGAMGAGEGVMGLSWAFLVAGCQTTLVSQWAVNSASTAHLMTAFYESWDGGGARKASAWRTAALAMMRDPRYRHPFYWASFALVGRN